MKYIFFLFAILSAVTAQASEPQIEAYKAAFHVGESVMACGTLKQVTIAPQQVYLNLDKPYPNQTLTILIWHNDYPKFTQHFGSLNKYVNKKLCARGTIKEYKNTLQINVSNTQFLRVMK